MMQWKLFHYQIPFVSSLDFKGHLLTQRSGCILQLSDENGRLSWGDICPLPGFSQESLLQAKTQIINLLEQNIPPLVNQARLYPSVKFALNCALQKIPLGYQSNNEIISTPLLQGDIYSQLAQYKALGCPRLVKIKVARASLTEDIALFHALINLNNNIQIRCDANQAWSYAQAAQFFTQIPLIHLDYIEEPTLIHQQNIALAQSYHISLALDETLQDPCFTYQPHPYIKALILKPSLLGCILKWVKIAQTDNLHINLSASFESSVALQQIRYLAENTSCVAGVSLGIDTLKYFQAAPLAKNRDLENKIQHLECIWHKN
ncbi:O-succinylbenzoate-CoA synthase [Psychromonas sp. CNPT3]|uniref:o-succinylbenzoate synthase n=1 Tax=Psychromonas sp. CNPT3 TaxID=314282 RepID=UPI00006E5068|nr:o-succinylbenzoate synthase [Psychromonas sp. CNPT3]AGH82443.1 O-succinylbenzoate-CoA synthase [Psychromonas sp. CNPT3]